MADQKAKRGVLLVNLGTPDSPSVPHVRAYLREFLMDPRVIDIPYPARFLLVNGVIAPFRAGQSAHAYRSIWRQEGSPLLTISRQVRDELRIRLEVPVELAMRYRNPSIAAALWRLSGLGVNPITVLPMFPHYATSSYESAIERVKELKRRFAPEAALRIVAPYFDSPGYIRSLVATAGPYLAGDVDHLLFSFHGVPERHIRRADPTGRHCFERPDCCTTESAARASCYRSQCLRTMAAVAREAGLEEGRYSYAFQSRLGRDRWLQPSTAETLTQLARSGVRKLAVMCPSFVADCLETLEEIGIRGRDTFREAGGESLILVPCLNTHPVWLDALADLGRG
jgi:protoporphyrin/coproporphyrin ferrochelatase